LRSLIAEFPVKTFEAFYLESLLHHLHPHRSVP
jgi:hypothetical protein